MSNVLALAAVTAVLKDLLNDGLINHDLSASVGNVAVSAHAPNLVTTGKDDAPQLNLFMYHVTPNSGWRNVGLPSRDSGGERLTNPPLALDLHYLLTAYGSQDFQAEILLGFAMQLLHETPVLTRQAIRATLQAPSPVDGALLPPARRAMAAAALAEQAEQIKIIPESLSTEEIAKLWSAFQAPYRPTAAYRVSVVLIEATQPAKSPLPVLTRGSVESGAGQEQPFRVRPDLVSSLPALLAVHPLHRQASARLGEVVILAGQNLAGTDLKVRFTHPQLTTAIELDPEAGATPTQLAVRLPEQPEAWPAGMYTVAVLLQQPGEEHRRTTNELPLALAPRLDLPLDVVRANSEVVTLTVRCSPQVRPGQRVALVLDDQEIPAQPHPDPTGTLTFARQSLAAGDYRVRLRIDGVDSRLIDRSVTPPVFDASQSVTIP